MEFTSPSHVSPYGSVRLFSTMLPVLEISKGPVTAPAPPCALSHSLAEGFRFGSGIGCFCEKGCNDRRDCQSNWLAESHHPRLHQRDDHEEDGFEGRVREEWPGRTQLSNRQITKHGAKPKPPNSRAALFIYDTGLWGRFRRPPINVCHPMSRQFSPRC